ncbi:MAG: polysaccharide biosynthesis C-terminal domain-containing protein, partial [Chloroflexota bacterium]|nr:polysaccharide biosynthesis C-terminal domain-containing protein [Chloroflexota bacterium]
TRTPVALSVAAMATNILLATVLVGPLGHIGIALAMSASASLETVALLALLNRRLPHVVTLGLLWTVSRTGLAAVAMGVATVLALVATRSVLGMPPVLQLVGAVALGGTTYAGAAFVLRSPDLHDALGVLRRRLGGRLGRR